MDKADLEELLGYRECKKCNCTMNIPHYLEPTDYCNLCSQELVELLEAELKNVKDTSQYVADILRYLTQKGRASVPVWVANRAAHCVKLLDEAIKGDK